MWNTEPYVKEIWVARVKSRKDTVTLRLIVAIITRASPLLNNADFNKGYWSIFIII